MLKGLKNAARQWRYPVPHELRRRHARISRDGLETLKKSISTNYHRGWRAKERYSKAVYEADLENESIGRCEYDRRIVIPWLNAVCPLDGLKILEVGCGTGSSTVAMAEQGARVTGIDVDTDSLIVARDRCALYGQTADLREANAMSAGQLFRTGDFDLVILFACLEHMTIPERLQALPALWGLLDVGGLLAIIETPNRLWFYDDHTSLMPFFNWLPDELAFVCSRFSQREQFKDDFREITPVKMLEFLRLGRAASYHDLDVTIGTHRVISSLSSFHGYRYTLRRTIRERSYKALIKSMRPDLHDGWFEPQLDLIVAKP